MFQSERRKFIKLCTVAGIAVFSGPALWQFSRAGQVDSTRGSGHSLPGWQGKGTQPEFRIDGIAKVTGEKIFGRDFRAMDMPGWPSQQNHALVLRCNQVERRFNGVDWSQIPENAQPFARITAATLREHQLKLPAFYGSQMLLDEGNSPQYFGHAIAILLFDTFEKFATAKQALQFNSALIKYGEKTPPVTRDPYASWRIIRVEGDAGPTGEDRYSPMQDGIFFPQYRNHKVIWPTNANQAGDVSARGIYYADDIRRQVAEQSKAGNWHLVEGEYRTQIIEPMMMEPEAFNGWFDEDGKTLHMVLTSQSPQDFQELAAHLLAQSSFAANIKNLVIHSGFVGGGFGAKDHSIFPYYGLIASLFGKGAPVRLANNRFEQFQAGLKRHPFNMRNKLLVDKQTGKFQALLSEMQVDGGGRENFSASVAMVGASAIQSIYYFPRNDISSNANQSMNVDSGSMRGYGTLQSMTAMEMMVNRAAEELSLDPIELRMRNASETGWRNTQGAIPQVRVRYREILEKARAHSMWVSRADSKKSYEQDHPGFGHGVGFAIATKDYGTGAAAPSAAVQFDEHGQFSLSIGFMEMGTGTQTSQAMILQSVVGVPAEHCELAEIDAWSALQQFQTESPYTMSQQHQDSMAKDPLWTPVVSMASSASMSAYFQSHVTLEAARALLQLGLIPAAKQLWNSQGKTLNADVDPADIRWENDTLQLGDLPPLPLAEIAAEAHRSGLVTGVMAHAFNRWQWAEAEFEIDGVTQTRAIDGLALRRGGDTGKPDVTSQKNTSKVRPQEYQLVKRKAVRYPETALNNAMVTYYAPAAAIVEVSVNKGTGEVSILGLQNYLECGRPIVDQLVEGQIEGGVAMGIGHALYEYLPPLAEGAGNGSWNLHRYQVPLAKDVGVWKQKHEILPPESDKDPHKGIAEVVMIPVVAALAEAIYQATGLRFNDMPITPEILRKALNPEV